MSDAADDGTRRDAIEVTYSMADIVAMNLAAWRFWVGIIGMMAAVVIVIPVILALVDGYPIADSIAEIDWAFTGWLIVLLVAWLVVVTILSHWGRKRKGLHGPILFALDPRGVSVRGRQMESVIFWSSIRSIKARSDRVFFFLTSRSALIVPRRGFATSSEFEAFASTAAQLWRASRQSLR